MKSIYLQGLFTLFAAVLWQDSMPLPAGEATPPRPDLEGRLAPWSEAHGGHWRIEVDATDGHAEMIHGGAAPSLSLPDEDAGWIELARDWLEETEELHGIVPDSLVGQRVSFLPLGQIGSGDKWTVRFEQRLDGVGVVDGFVNVLFDVDGRLLSIQSIAAPELAEMNTAPFLTEAHAKAFAADHYRDVQGADDGLVETPELVILRVLAGKVLRPTLAWQVDVHGPDDGSAPAAWRFWIDDADGGLLQQRNLIHHWDVYGTVRSNASPGTAPDYASNPETQQELQHLRVTSSAGTTYTDANGDFNFPGVNSAMNVTVEYTGTYNDVRNQGGSDYSLTTSALPNQQNDILMNPSSQALATAEANAFKQLTGCRDWITTIIPTDTTADFQAVSNCNITSTCNAYYNGSSVNFYQAGGGCVNTAYSTVVVHEYGHWLNDLYGSGNGSDGFGEGNADMFSMYMYDDPIVGLDFCGSGCNVRTGLNTRPYCGDGNGGCYGQVHADGEVWMGAGWKIRTRLKTTHGVSAGGLVADTLFLSWMNAYNQTTIDSIIEIQWLTLDDDDGNIDNGTPNYTDIDQGFRDQQFPGYDLPGLSITGVTDLPDTTSEVGPYVVDATIVAQVAPPITTADLYYRVNGGTWTTVAMTDSGGDVYTGAIPGQSSPANINYYVYAEDNGSASRSFPPDAPTSYLDFNVGDYEVLFFDDFEGSGDNGWTHASFGDTSNNQDDWQHGSPGGQAGDPSSAYSGTKVWGNDLGNSGWNGEYQDEVHNYLRSPSIDCTEGDGTRLRFQRWLRVEKGTWDQAVIKVNGTVVWENPAGTDLLDNAWTYQDLDISAEADGQPSVQIEFSLQSDTSLTFGGWTLDDVAVLYLVDSGITDCNENGIDDAIDISSGTSLDCQGNGIPDECEMMGNDCNANGIPDDCDVAAGDCNSNGIPDDCEVDCNGNGTPDDCETFTDCNGSGVPDECELYQNDCNGNGIPDECDTDCNSNGTPDDCETFTDCNGNGIPDECDLSGNDCNSNGIPDECDTDCNANGTPDDCESFTDCNGNSIPDECELAGNDCDANGVPDECDPDCNGNGTPDACESFTDCNGNSIPDECELDGNDCNANGVPDECDLVSDDCNSNGIPDDCETFDDCNINGIPDECELSGNDCDANGVPDECDLDCNGNGMPDACESFTDCNGNSIPDECELIGNDCNSNGIPDECDLDCNSNGTPDDCESFTDCNGNSIPDECELSGNDCNGNGVPDECDTDCNSNGTPDDCESFTDCNGNSVPDECELSGNDCDSNGVPDECDPDCNGNGTPDACESFTDCNGNGVPDECELSGNDCNSNGVPDECDTDCNANGTPDDCESFTDCNGNSIPDECELVGNDCNSNGIPDECDLVGNDCNSNGIPDDCESFDDCNNNSIPDECELSGNDCDSNGVPDECDPDCNGNGTPDACETFEDCNENGIPDECDITSGTSQDQDGNGIPDECNPGTAFCFGDGSGTPCPCGNTGAAGAGCANSVGTGGVLGASGTASVSVDDLSFISDGLIPGQPALLFFGLNEVNGGAGLVFGDGLRCAGGAVIRLGTRVPDVFGTAVWGPSLANAGGWSSGDVRSFQGWYRDPLGGPCGNEFNTTNGLTVTFQP